MPGMLRWALLLQEGYNEKEVASATRDAAYVRHQRIQTVASLPFAAADEKLESIRRNFTKLFKIGENKEEERIKMFMKTASCNS